MSYLAYKELKVWSKAVDFAASALAVAPLVEVDRKHFRLIEQLESASTSVALNIAEGKGRQHTKEFIQHLYIARGSLYEVLTLLEVFQRNGWIDQNMLNEFEAEGIQIIKMLKGLINSLK